MFAAQNDETFYARKNKTILSLVWIDFSNWYKARMYIYDFSLKRRSKNCTARKLYENKLKKKITVKKIHNRKIKCKRGSGKN